MRVECATVVRTGPSCTRAVLAMVPFIGKRPQKTWHAWCVLRMPRIYAQGGIMQREPEVALATLGKPMKRQDVTDLIAFRKITKGIKWAEVAKKVGAAKEWTTAACLGQMQMTKKQAETVGKIFDLPEDAVIVLQAVPYKGSLPTAVPTDPLIYRFYELVSVYGTTFKELIHEEFGDGIMSAIDFDLDLTRLPNEKGDRVKIVMSGKYLQYKTY